MSEKNLLDAHQNLDLKMVKIIQNMIKRDEVQKAANIVRLFIKSPQIGKNIIDIFDESGYRGVAIELEYFYD